MLDELLTQLRKLDLDSAGNIKSTVANIRLMSSLRNKLAKIILNPDYIQSVNDFIEAFNQVTILQNAYWKTVEANFKPTPLLREIKQQVINDVIDSLTENGVKANITDAVNQVLKTNITAGGSYKSLESQLRELLTDTDQSDGLLTKYTKQVTTDSINQYSRQYTQVVSSDLGFEWYSYANTLIETSRPFCIAMHERDFFHVSEIPDLLNAVDLEYTNPKTGKKEPVPIYDKTGLPQGMYPNENEENFLILLGGYNCGHQCQPVSEALVPNDIVERVKLTSSYKTFKKS